ncbi:outer membrane beta-barrel protein [Bdellovibrio svalbardensis]|uniref:Porin n=1 Tax=Bdellovibrio svalbardensis TaxID=2972972 RepID=A0ABT6DQB6_9BACT|nr:outer membrane beta-barrel protein [Bdellovibrio svalbardensis]MDG0818026.1 porin [Bdellovibrio svalbardensis]
MKLTTITLNIATLLSSVSVHAADFGGVKVTGEASFDYNYLSSGDNRYPAAGGASPDTYRFNQAQILISKETDELSLLARLNYTPVDYMQSSTASGKASFGSLDQLEVYYKVRPDFSIGFGRLSTTLGFESCLKTDNIFYSNTVAYQGIVPGYGEGLRAKYTPGEWLALTLTTYNRSPYGSFGDDNTPTKSTELSATGILGTFTWFAGSVMGTDGDSSPTTRKVERQTSSIWFTNKFSDSIALSGTYDSRSQKPQDGSYTYAQSVSGQLAYTSGKNTLAVRYESVLGAGELDTLNGTASSNFYPGADKVQIWSASENYHLTENLKVFLEYRHDDIDQPVLKNSAGDATKDLYMVTLGALAHF